MLWAINTTSGKREPLDPEPRADGNIEIVGYEEDELCRQVPQIRHLTGDELPLFGTPTRYVSHFVTCPDAGRFRKP